MGHTVIAFQTLTQLQAAEAKLIALGFGSGSLVQYTPAEMLALVEAELFDVSPMASFGYELNLVYSHRKLAENGCFFLIVEAPTNTLSAQAAALVQDIQPASAQHYGRFMIEDLTEKPPGRMTL